MAVEKYFVRSGWVWAKSDNGLELMAASPNTPPNVIAGWLNAIVRMKAERDEARDAIANTAAAVTDAAKGRDEAERELREARAELDAVRERNETLQAIVARIPGVVSYVTATLSSATDDPDAEWGKVHRGRAFSSINQLKALATQVYEVVQEEDGE